MTNRHSKGHRDNNENRLLKIARRYGYTDWDDVRRGTIKPEYVQRFYQKCDDNDGHDLNFWDEFGSFTVEVKTDEWGEWARKLRPNEILFRDMCHSAGVHYYIVATEEEMADLLAERIKIK